MAQNEKTRSKAKNRVTRSGKRSGYHHGDLKNALLKSAIGFLREHGPQAFSLRELALSVGVSSAAPYRHFKTKEKLFSALAAQGFRKLTENFKAAIESEPKDSLQRLHAVGVSYYRFAVDYPEHLQMMFGNIIPQSEIAKDPELGAEAGEAFATLVKVIVSCQTDGSLDAKADPRMLAILIWSSVHGFAALDMPGTLKNASGLIYNPENLIRRISGAMASGLT